ncbi:MAG: sialidase family protein, partial [bacterium]
MDNLLKQINLFKSGENGYHTYRIPALTVTKAGTVLVFCEGRKSSRSDSGDIDILLKRSTDNGETWAETQVVAENGKDTAGNPAPVVDGKTGNIILLFTQNLADGGETEICKGNAPRTVWKTVSKDDGKTWSESEEITDQVKKSAWTWYATGPCHGIQLESGRLVIPCDHIVGKDFNRETDPYHSHIIYSDDGGRNWNIGGIVDKNTNESVVVETVDNNLYINCRQIIGNKRAYAWSRDQGESFSELQYSDTLIEPQCQASMIRYTTEADYQKNR